MTLKSLAFIGTSWISFGCSWWPDWRSCSLCICGRRIADCYGLWWSLRFLCCWRCNMGGRTASGCRAGCRGQSSVDATARFREEGSMKLQKLLIGIALAGLILLLAPMPSFSPGCALCYTQAASAGARMIQALRSGILVLIIPPTLATVGMIFVVHHKRNQFKRPDHPGEWSQDW